MFKGYGTFSDQNNVIQFLSALWKKIDEKCYSANVLFFFHKYKLDHTTSYTKKTRFACHARYIGSRTT